MQVIELNRDQLLVPEGVNPRGDEEITTDDLELTIPAFGGLLYPILVVQAEGGYEVRDGYRRVATLDMLYKRDQDEAWRKIPAIVVPRAEAAAEAALMLVANVSRRAIKPSRIAAAIVMLAESYLWDQYRIAAHTGFKPQEVLTYCDLHRADEALKARVDRGDLSLTNFRQYAAKLPKHVQAELAGMESLKGDRIKKAIREKATEAQPERLVDDETLVEKLNQAAALILDVQESAPYSASIARRIAHAMTEIRELVAEEVAVNG